MKRHSGSKKLNISASGLWTAAAILLVCILLTAAALVESLKQFSYKTEPDTVISLLAAENGSAAPSSLQSALPPVQSATPSPSPTATAAPTPIPSPHFFAGDDRQVWSSTTEVDIFRAAYENDEGFLIAASGNGDKIVAPGTHNSYRYHLTNDGDVPIKYRMYISATASDAFMSYGIPVRVRLSDESGEWLCGSADSWESFTELDGTEKSAVLGSMRYSVFTLDWDWPYDSGDDALDTLLGELEGTEELVLAVNINVTAEYEPGAANTSGYPKTGDEARPGLWLGLMLLSLLGCAAVVSFGLRRRGSGEV